MFHVSGYYRVGEELRKGVVLNVIIELYIVVLNYNVLKNCILVFLP